MSKICNRKNEYFHLEIAELEREFLMGRLCIPNTAICFTIQDYDLIENTLDFIVSFIHPSCNEEFNPEYYPSSNYTFHLEIPKNSLLFKFLYKLEEIIESFNNDKPYDIYDEVLIENFFYELFHLNVDFINTVRIQILE